MVKIIDEELSAILSERQQLITLYQRKEIDTKTYDEKMSIIMKTMDLIRERLIKKFEINNSQPLNIMEDNKLKGEKQMAKEQVVKETVEPKITKPVKPKVESLNALIVKALMLRSTKSAADVAVKVKEWRPEVDVKKVTSTTKAIVGLIKKATIPRWAKYNFDETTYLLTSKETV